MQYGFQVKRMESLLLVPFEVREAASRCAPRAPKFPEWRHYHLIWVRARLPHAFWAVSSWKVCRGGRLLLKASSREIPDMLHQFSQTWQLAKPPRWCFPGKLFSLALYCHKTQRPHHPHSIHPHTWETDGLEEKKNPVMFANIEVQLTRAQQLLCDYLKAVYPSVALKSNLPVWELIKRLVRLVKSYQNQKMDPLD